MSVFTANLEEAKIYVQIFRPLCIIIKKSIYTRKTERSLSVAYKSFSL